MSALVVVALAGLAVFLGRRTHRARPEMRDADGWAPPAPLLGLASLVLTSAFVTAWYAGRNTIPPWVLAGLVVAGYVVAVALVAHWSRRLRWTRTHQLALAGGALLTYAWHGFVTRPFLPTSPAVRLTSHVVFAAGAVVVLAVAAVRLRADPRDHLARPAARHSGASTDQISMSCRSPR
ncbi:hypothetical protein [Actinopolymorpha singaporensis]|uniref:hypothetical protein n=1 Tax=Actinopolymorpha singaporensis TaxID=117157 RepID=UPI000B890AFA|nr:hypothetical protein [Actinopolymorpha singaporensis]